MPAAWQVGSGKLDLAHTEDPGLRSAVPPGRARAARGVTRRPSARTVSRHRLREGKRRWAELFAAEGPALLCVEQDAELL
jgi:hypothetical protein